MVVNCYLFNDASNFVPFAKFYPYEGVFPCREVIKKTIEIKGLFHALYVDKASHFKTTRYGGLHVNINDEHEHTHIERALNELGINLIPANSPQAKGRIERLFRTFQDRLIKEMRLNNIKNYDSANHFLISEFLPYYNRKFAKSNSIPSVYSKLTNLNLDFIFCKKYQRKVNFDNTIKIFGKIIQIPPSKYRLSFARCVVDVCLLPDNKLFILYKNNIIHSCPLPDNKFTKVEKKIDKFLSQRVYAYVE